MKHLGLVLFTYIAACSIVPGMGAPRPAGPNGAKAGKGAAAAPVIACYQAQAVFYSRPEKPEKAPFLGYQTLTGPVACPTKVDAGGLPGELPLTGYLLSATAGKTWDRQEQDKLHPGDTIRYHFRAFDIVFAEKSRPDTNEIVAATDWRVEEAFGKQATDAEVRIGPPPTIQSFNGWIAKLGEARPVFERFYQRRRQSDNTVPHGWYDDNVYGCFEALGKGDFCGAEISASSHPSNASANPLPEAAYCELHAHLLHLPYGTSCHGPVQLPPGTSKCIDSCNDQFKSCVLATDNTGACGGTKNECSTQCFSKHK